MTDLERALKQIEIYEKALLRQDTQGYDFTFETNGVNMARFLEAVKNLLQDKA